MRIGKLDVMIVEARRWFDGVNTYHSVRIVDDEGDEHIAPFTYGYGDHWRHTAGVLCGLPDPYAFRFSDATVVDVQRKRDLHNAGRPWSKHVDLSVDVPKRGDGRILFTLRMAGYTITAWDTCRTSSVRGRVAFMGRLICGIKATKDGKIVFLTDQWSPSPCHSIDGPEAQHDAVGWVADAVDDETGGPLGCERAWRWENPENGNFDPKAARAYRAKCKADAKVGAL